MLSHSSLSRLFSAGLVITFALILGSIGMGQSGRRVRKSTPVPESTPESTPTPSPNTVSEKPKPLFTFLVGLDRFNSFANIPLYAYDGVLRTLAARLAEPQWVHVGASQSEMSRGDAIRKAKAEKEGYVVWLQLSSDSISGNTRNSGNLDNIVIEYWVFAPTTAKLTTSGRTYTQSQRNRIIIPGPGTSSIYGDRYLNRAAQEAADRILAHFRLHAPPNRRT